jgi:hypothetical protein
MPDELVKNKIVFFNYPFNQELQQLGKLMETLANTEELPLLK